MEFVKRGKVAFSDFMVGMYDRLDIAIYQIYLQSCVFGFTSQMRRNEADVMYKRIINFYGEPGKTKLGIDVVPVEMGNLACGAFKIEYMFSGTYHVKASDEYKSIIHGVDDTTKIAQSQKFSPKFVDTMNMNKFQMMGLMWMESLYRPGVVVKFYTCILQGGLLIKMANIRMMSVIIDCSNIITITKIEVV